MTDVYLKKFTHLHVDKSSARWAKSTNYYAPHKPLLLLSVIDLIAQGLIQKNLIELNAELIDTFDLYWLKIIGTEKRTTPVLPFFHLQSDSFWYLIPVPGKE